MGTRQYDTKQVGQCELPGLMDNYRVFVEPTLLGITVTVLRDRPSEAPATTSTTTPSPSSAAEMAPTDAADTTKTSETTAQNEMLLVQLAAQQTVGDLRSQIEKQTGIRSSIQLLRLRQEKGAAPKASDGDDTTLLLEDDNQLLGSFGLHDIPMTVQIKLAIKFPFRWAGHDWKEERNSNSCTQSQQARTAEPEPEPEPVPVPEAQLRSTHTLPGASRATLPPPVRRPCHSVCRFCLCQRTFRSGANPE